MVQFMKIAMSAGVALALSFLFYDRRDLSAGRELFRGRYGIQGPSETAAEFRERTVEAFAPTIGGAAGGVETYGRRVSVGQYGI